MTPFRRECGANASCLWPARQEDLDRTMEQKSKSQVKREMLGLQALGEQLVELSPDQISKIEMSQDLREAVLFAGKLKRGEALRRQMQYIGTLMRQAELEPIRKALDDISRGQRLDAQRFHKIEQWRNGLIDGNDEILEDLLAQFPDADRQRLRQCVLNARKEKAADQPPKASRALFRYLSELCKI
jgi:ribosome-associated protein